MTDRELLDLYAQGPDVLETRLHGVAPEVLDARPDYTEAWTIKEHVIHLADSEANNLIRLKSILAQPGAEVFVIDEDRWTRNLQRKHQDMGKYLRLFRLVREIVVELVVDELASNQDFYLRTRDGETRQITLREGLAIYANHVGFHLPYIDRILAARAQGRAGS